MDEPLTVNRSSGMPSGMDVMQRHGGEGIAHLETVDILDPKTRAIQALRVASTAPVWVIAVQASLQPRMRARGFRPRFFIAFSETTSAAAAPSAICGELPTMHVADFAKFREEGAQTIIAPLGANLDESRISGRQFFTVTSLRTVFVGFENDRTFRILDGCTRG